MPDKSANVKNVSKKGGQQSGEGGKAAAKS